MTELEVPEGWESSAGRLRRELKFADFSEAFAFMTRCALVAERLDHHPNWSNVYDTVTIELYSHDAGAVTDRDVAFAEAVNRILAAPGPR